LKQKYSKQFPAFSLTGSLMFKAARFLDSSGANLLNVSIAWASFMRALV
jgi:hypothetical protein